MTFGEKFKTQRKKNGWTQQEVAERLGVTRRMIVSYESDKALPRYRETYQKIAELFGIDVNYLLTEDREFVVEATEKYGRRGSVQAEEVIAGFSGLCAGGALSEEDKDAVMKALQDIYWESKARNVQKYTPRKYREQPEQ